MVTLTILVDHGGSAETPSGSCRQRSDTGLESAMTTMFYLEALGTVIIGELGTMNL